MLAQGLGVAVTTIPRVKAKGRKNNGEDRRPETTKLVRRTTSRIKEAGETITVDMACRPKNAANCAAMYAMQVGKSIRYRADEDSVKKPEHGSITLHESGFVDWMIEFFQQYRSMVSKIVASMASRGLATDMAVKLLSKFPEYRPLAWLKSRMSLSFSSEKHGTWQMKYKLPCSVHPVFSENTYCSSSKASSVSMMGISAVSTTGQFLCTRRCFSQMGCIPTDLAPSMSIRQSSPT